MGAGEWRHHVEAARQRDRVADRSSSAAHQGIGRPGGKPIGTERVVAAGEQRGIEADARDKHLQRAIRRGRLDLVGEENAKSQRRHHAMERDQHEQGADEGAKGIADDGHGDPHGRQLVCAEHAGR